MNRSRSTGRRPLSFLPWSENLESRQLLSRGSFPPYVSPAELYSLLHNPVGYPAVRPNTPALPYGAPSKQAAFVDPSARIINGYAVIVSSPGFIAPYSTLNAHGGIIKIGTGTDIMDNATIVANPLHPHKAPAPEVLIGDQVWVGYGATILGPSTIGAYGSSVQPTEIGPGAVIDQATVEPGAIVGALARVGPGVTVPSGYRVLPGKNVTTNAAAADPALGLVVPVTNSDTSTLSKLLTANLTLAQGYTTIYQGQFATGASPGIGPPTTNVYNGDLATVLGSGQQPGSPTASTAFLPPGTGPTFPTPSGGRIQGNFSGFRARITGGVVFQSSAGNIAHHLGRSNSIRGDIGQPITIGSIGRTGFGLSINAPGNGPITIGRNLVVGNNVTIMGDSTAKMVLGDDVTIGNGAVVEGSSLGSGSTVGARACLLNSTFPAGTQIPAGAIYENNKLVGYVEW